ncbi:MAG: DEAD/DEAH box helicase family protein [Pseudomonadota bacterium]
MKLKFDASLDYQQDAIASVVDLFEGVPGQHSAYTELGIANEMLLDANELAGEKILQNLRAIQERNFVEKSHQLIAPDDAYRFANFSVEMETGTGKTYVYLRTLFELHRRFGLRKFIIVVPSVAIREGVTSSIALMKDHFRGLYDNAPFDHYVYNSSDLSKVRQFATANTIQILVINVQAFQKDAGEGEDYQSMSDEQRKKLSIIHRDQDRMSGRRPIEFIQTTRPVIIIDEPQSVDSTPKARRAIQTLRPLFALRYSATHKNPYNVLYQLGPVKAYDLKLVKQIAVASIEAENNYNRAFLRLDHIGYDGKAKTPSAKVTIYEDTAKGTKEKIVKLKQGTDLSDHTNRDGYQGYVVDEIYAEPGAEYVRFTNNVVLEPEQQQGGVADDIMRAQIRQTVEEHFKKERNLQKRGKAVKVLSLFFIDRVDNYRSYNDQGETQPGKLARWFEEAYTEISARAEFSTLPKRDVASVHDGYFSTDRKKGKVVALKDTTGATAADDETYALIMRDKERLLSEEEPLRFIFSHSALKEGWDNPNVFQICSLRELGTERERRQTLGRGLRLPVDANGDRIYDPAINRLTVVASESFEHYARQLQAEIEKDIGGGFKFGRVPKIAFATLAMDNQPPLSQEQSEQLWQALQDRGYLNEQGDISDAFNPLEKGFTLDVPEEFSSLRHAIADKLISYLFKGRVVDSRNKQPITYNKRVELNPDFQVLWEKIKHKTRYHIEFSTAELIEKAVKKIKEMADINPVSIISSTHYAKITDAGFEEERQVQSSRAQYVNSHSVLPDIISWLQQSTELTRGTLLEILKRCGRLNEFKLNPQAFMTEVAKRIHSALSELLVDGIRYEKLDQEYYEMALFNQPELEAYLDKLYKIQYANADDDVRTPYDYIEWGSSIEHEVARKLDEADNVLFFCKLPRWFKVTTPVGDYNPDWAVVLQGDKKLYLIRETKSTHDNDKRRLEENLKIKCAKAHFGALEGVNYKVATSVGEVLGL